MSKSYEPSISMKEIIEITKEAPITYLLKAARSIGCREYAIIHYYNKKSKYHLDQTEARHALRKYLHNLSLQKPYYGRHRIEIFLDSLEESGYTFKVKRMIEK